MVRKIIAYNHYFVDFYKAQEEKVQEKIEYVLDLVRFEKQVPKKFFKALKNTDGIYEVRIITTFKSIRILCFQDDGNLIILVNCFVKKTQKNTGKRNQTCRETEKEISKRKKYLICKI